jgi:hypothetical protein
VRSARVGQAPGGRVRDDGDNLQPVERLEPAAELFHIPLPRPVAAHRVDVIAKVPGLDLLVGQSWLGAEVETVLADSHTAAARGGAGAAQATGPDGHAAAGLVQLLAPVNALVIYLEIDVACFWLGQPEEVSAVLLSQERRACDQHPDPSGVVALRLLMPADVIQDEWGNHRLSSMTGMEVPPTAQVCHGSRCEKQSV